MSKKEWKRPYEILPASKHALLPPSLRKGLATQEDAARMTPEELAIRYCDTCKLLYTKAGYAYQCEHWHLSLEEAKKKKKKEGWK